MRFLPFRTNTELQCTRPFPMIGNFFANCFVHFEPYESIDGRSFYDPKKDIPPYLKPGSTWEINWRTDNPLGWKGVSLFRGVGNDFRKYLDSFLTICRFTNRM